MGSAFMLPAPFILGTVPLFLDENQRWFSIAELDGVPMTAPHRRALKKLLA